MTETEGHDAGVSREQQSGGDDRCPECGSENTNLPPQTMEMPMRRECLDCGNVDDADEFYRNYLGAGPKSALRVNTDAMELFPDEK